MPRACCTWPGAAARPGRSIYSRAKAGEAAAAGWSAPQELPSPPRPALAADWPQLGIDAAGRLTVAYVVPINEGRGVYVVQSQDGGESWSPPATGFRCRRRRLGHGRPSRAGRGPRWRPAPGLDQGRHARRQPAPGHLLCFVAPRPGRRRSAGRPALERAPPPGRGGLRLAPAGLGARRSTLALCPRERGHHLASLGRCLFSLSQYPGEGRGEGQPYGLAAWKPAARVPGWQDMALPVGLGRRRGYPAPGRASTAAARRITPPGPAPQPPRPRAGAR